MNNFDFVKRFLLGTKEGKLKWHDSASNIDPRLPSSLNNFDQIFYVQRPGGSFVLSARAPVFSSADEIPIDVEYAVIILDSLYHEIYRITSENLFDTDSSEENIYVSENDKFLLSRLFRLAQRNAMHIDKLLESLSADLPSEEDDLPF